jgi:uncharacterized protein
MKMFTGWMLALALALTSGLGSAWASKVAPAAAADVKILDGGKLFTGDGIKQATKAFVGPRGLVLTIETFEKIPASQQADFDQAKDDPAKRATFFNNWAKSEAKADKAKGVFVLVCRSPGEVRVITDRETEMSGFTAAKEKELTELLLTGLRKAGKEEAAKQQSLRDETLVAAVKYVGDAVPKMVNTSGSSTHSNHAAPMAGAGNGIGQWICLGLCVLAGIWLVTGLIRAFSGGGGGMGGPGGGGGGFMSGLMGGLFGAMAGAYLYNSFFSDHGNSAHAGDNTAGNTGDTGAGDYSNSSGAGGSYDGGGDTGAGGDFGGGDFGGGGGDF